MDPYLTSSPLLFTYTSHVLTLRDLFVITAYFLSILQATQQAQKDFITWRAVATSTTHTHTATCHNTTAIAKQIFTLLTQHRAANAVTSHNDMPHHSTTYPHSIAHHSGAHTHHRRNAKRGMHFFILFQQLKLAFTRHLTLF